jgi:hypothetical protein
LSIYSETELPLDLIAELCSDAYKPVVNRERWLARLLGAYWLGNLASAATDLHRLEGLKEIHHLAVDGSKPYQLHVRDPGPQQPGSPQIQDDAAPTVRKRLLPVSSLDQNNWTLENCTAAFAWLAAKCTASQRLPWYMKDGSAKDWFEKCPIAYERFRQWCKGQGLNEPQFWRPRTPVARRAGPAPPPGRDEEIRRRLDAGARPGTSGQPWKAFAGEIAEACDAEGTRGYSVDTIRRVTDDIRRERDAAG